MNIRVRFTPEETRARILEAAEEHFRRIGYAKTAVADIAAALGMSPANVYRFFPSKNAIIEAICERVLGEAHALMRSIAATDAPATQRLESIALALHRYNKRNFTDERRVHDMVAAAMEENRAAIEAHLATVVEIFAEVIADGVRRGEFPAQNVPLAALTVKNCLASVFHPQLIAACAHYDLENQAVRVVRFVVAALKVAPELPAPDKSPFRLPASIA